MLVLTRKLGESIVIADDIVVQITAIDGNRVKLGINAPRSRRVLRGEIVDSLAASDAVPPTVTESADGRREPKRTDSTYQRGLSNAK